MDPNTGRLRALSADEANVLNLMQKSQKNVMIVGDGKPEFSKASFVTPLNLVGLERVPEGLQQEAQDALGGQQETFVDLKSDTGLAKWAAKRRKENKKKTKKKMAKKSRKINRKK